MIGLKKQYFCVDFKKLKHAFVTKCLKKGKSQRNAATLFHDVFIVRHTISRRI
jgi:hypothetical protein